jgi:hypothetical protein
MANKDKVKYNAYMKVYMLKRYHARRKIAIKYLGGKCIDCGSKKELEFDHIEPKEKSFSIAKLWSVKEEEFWKEINKCNLRCKNCHIIKTVLQNGQTMAKGTHGTLSARSYCNCNECKTAYNIYKKEWREKRKNKAV